MSVRRVLLVPCAVLLLGAAACSADSDPGTTPPSSPPASVSPSGPSSSAPASAPATTPASSPPTTTPTTPSSTALPRGGTAASPRALTAVVDRLDWQPVEGSSGDTVTQTAEGSIRVDQGGTTVTVTDAEGASGLAAPRGFRFSDVVTDGTYLVAVAQDKAEERPGVATVVTLADGTRRTLSGASTPPTVNGGSWAIGGGRVFHATGRNGSYCLASVTLPALTGRTTYCAPPRAGFSGVTVTDAGVSLLTFGGRPQCRTPARLAGAGVAPLPGVTRCTGWDSALTPAGALAPRGAIWSVVPNPRSVDTARFLARVGDDYYDLGSGATGTLTWCGSSAYFTRDVQRDAGKARVLRWSPETGLSVVYETRGTGQAFVTQPRCAGDVLTISAFGEGGDEQVWARVD